MTIYNFSAGPAVLPHEVLVQARDEMLDWHGSGMSVMEMSHRGKEFMGIAAAAEKDLRELMNIPANYKVLFLQGGASQQFAMIPMNLLRGKTSADYLNTGEWSKKAISEAKKFGKVNVVASSEDKNFSYVPDFAAWKCDPNAAYLHITPNETIGGVEFDWLPNAGNVPLVADLSSTILSRPIDVSKFGLIYAGAQKNIGPAGLTIVIVREDLIGQVVAGTPTMLDYKTHADNDSMYNTPPTYGIYIAGLVFQMLKRNGGVAAMEKTNIAKARLLYDAIDASKGFYNCPVALANRSRMNVPFTLKDANLDGEFVKQADARGLLQLKGHRSVGGMRASIYNAMPLAGVQALVSFMAEFAKNNS
ncbi:MAG: phosphoserine transaminase [Gallionellales bacterium 35-53-114]|jgi:phosphoserine aminotransferase|nr:MAG: phosphoserine transaminase [Gallionellales bacterium 35-53-114]OYZ65341.1 MAG: phosphoserine transaminase [Gallionellales bacterium 24-53-125]OZB08248.1 MAG: phosphoserine transaminase [Gallionellales bacterium 39-52-133]HQS58178.1 3-phosphoserine/phosphohydroxythreonine transaminase [Gallionellaceae bacterium]HQS73733.1 3-phosphoserine/phosphohydroxythreonine transaminase [Gallionellaceae bacterium]